MVVILTRCGLTWSSYKEVDLKEKRLSLNFRRYHFRSVLLDTTRDVFVRSKLFHGKYSLYEIITLLKIYK